MKKPIGIILYSGKSLFDGERIIVIATGVFTKTENRKTGDVIQTWILRREIPPILARRLGEDKSICHNCKHREAGTCYVNIGQSPRAIYNAYHDGRYRDFEDSDLELFRNRVVRIGSYGDPGAIPYEVWNKISSVAKAHVGYTHQWQTCDQRLKNICMASVDSIVGYTKEYDKAQSMGWRTFRVRESLENELSPIEIVCPASKEANILTNCQKCNLCSGNSKAGYKNPVIMIHGDSEVMGSLWRRDRYIAMMKKIKWKKSWRKDYKSNIKKFKEACKI